MRTLVHLVLLICGIAVAVGSFMYVLAGGVKPDNVRLEDLRDGFPAGWAIEQLGDQSVTFYRSMAILLLAAAVLILIAALFGSRIAAWIGIIVGLGDSWHVLLPRERSVRQCHQGKLLHDPDKSDRIHSDGRRTDSRSPSVPGPPPREDPSLTARQPEGYRRRRHSLVSATAGY